MKKASKLISMLLSAAMVCTLLAGCGNSGGSAQDGSAGKESVSPLILPARRLQGKRDWILRRKWNW